MLSAGSYIYPLCVDCDVGLLTSLSVTISMKTKCQNPVVVGRLSIKENVCSFFRNTKVEQLTWLQITQHETYDVNVRLHKGQTSLVTDI